MQFWYIVYSSINVLSAHISAQGTITMRSPEQRYKAPQDQQSEPLETSPGKERGFKKWHKVGAGIAGLTLVAGGAGVLGTKLAGGSDRTPEKRPAAEAPETPGKGASEQGQETAPNPEEAKNWNEKTVPFFADFKNNSQIETYTGVENFKKAAEVSAEDNPTPEEASRVMFSNRVTQWINFGNDPMAQQNYSEYISKSNPGQFQGAQAIVSDYDIDGIYRNALTFDNADGAPNPDFLKTLNDEFRDKIATLRMNAGAINYYSQQAGGEPYYLRVDVESTTCKTSLNLRNASGCETTVSYHDNFELTGVDEYQKKNANPEFGLTGTGLFTKQQGTEEFNYDYQIQNGRWGMPGAAIPPSSN